jgi:UDPglucose--hexose-1-phosphate uridylyltransferase
MNENKVKINIERLLIFAKQHGMLEPLDVISARNALLDLFGFSEPYEGAVEQESLETAVPILEPLLDYAAEKGLIPENTITHRDLFDARMMGLLIPRPSELSRRFRDITANQSIEAATNDYYKFSISSNYIRMDRILKNKHWLFPTPYGSLEITINLSKPEKDPKQIAAERNMPQSSYPKCLLCEENVGYAGRLNHPARQNHRIIPLQISAEAWCLQYSPYVYYNEHSIVFSKAHVPMQITSKTFERLVDFTEQFPHYFIGSNADLPIVGGSILNHDHFQAGRHAFPMELANVLEEFKLKRYQAVKAGIVKWPMSVIRLSSQDNDQLIAAACAILDQWRSYSDAEAQIEAFSEVEGKKTPHNTITPIARSNAAGEFELDLVLRNNRTTAERPSGLFHPREALHHIKQENIGLIEVMGLAILPGRLLLEMEEIRAILTGDLNFTEAMHTDRSHSLHKHAAWIRELIESYGTDLALDKAKSIIEQQVGDKFLQVLSDAGVYKQDDAGQAAFGRFMDQLNAS